MRCELTVQFLVEELLACNRSWKIMIQQSLRMGSLILSPPFRENSTLKSILITQTGVDELKKRKKWKWGTYDMIRHIYGNTEFSLKWKKKRSPFKTRNAETSSRKSQGIPSKCLGQARNSRSESTNTIGIDPEYQ